MNIPANEEPEPEPEPTITEEDRREGLFNLPPDAIYIKWQNNILPTLPSRDNYIYTVVRAIVYMNDTFLRSIKEETLKTKPLTLSQWLSCLNSWFTTEYVNNSSDQCRKSTGTGLSLPSNRKLKPGITGTDIEKIFRQIYKIVSTYSSTSPSDKERGENTALINSLFKKKTWGGMGCGKKTRRRKAHPSTKKHKKNKKYKKRATTKKHKKYKKNKKMPRTRKR
jgi:hypothetical protein